MANHANRVDKKNHDPTLGKKNKTLTPSRPQCSADRSGRLNNFHGSEPGKSQDPVAVFGQR